MRLPRFFPAVFIFDIIVYLICLLGIWQIAEKAGLPFSVVGIGDGKFRVEKISAPALSSIRNGDVIISFREETVASLEGLEFILDGMKIGDGLPIKLDRGRTILETNVGLVPAYGRLYVVVAWFVGTLFFVSGIVVFFKKQDELPAIVYHFGAIAVSVVIMCTWGRYTIGPWGIGEFIRVIFSAAYAFVPALMLHFSVIFPTKRKTFISGHEYILYAIAALLSVGMGVAFVKAVMPYSMAGFNAFLAIFNVTRWFYAACVAGSVAMFVGSYRVAKEEMERRKLRWIMLGLIISSLGFVSLWQIPQLLTSRGLVREEVVVLLSGTTPIAFTVAIVRYHVLNIDQLFNRSTVYVLLLIILLSVYSVIVGVTAAFVGQLTVANSMVVAAAAAVAVALLFEPVRRRVQIFVDKNFFRVRYDLRTVESGFAESLKRCVAPEEVAGLAVETVAQSIPIERIGYFMLEKDGTRLRLLAHEGFDVIESRSVPFDLRNLKSTLTIPVAPDGKIESGASYEKSDSEVFRRWGLSLVLPVRSEAGGILSFLVLGQKKSGLRYSIEDIDLLGFIASYAGNAHERIVLQSRLAFEKEERERLEELNRMKTYFVSSVSHDLKTPLTTIMMYAESLGNWRKMPASSVVNYLDTIRGESERLTRLINNVLDVAKSERGRMVYRKNPEVFDDTVRTAVDAMEYEAVKEDRRISSSLTLKKRKFIADRDSVVESIQNLIANAMEYSRKKSKIRVCTFAKDDRLCVSVEDSGIGIAKEDLPHLFEPFFRGSNCEQLRPGGTGLGLSVVKNIVDAHEGDIEIESELGRGTLITLSFPAMEAK